MTTQTTTWTHHYAGDGTETGDMILRAMNKAYIERARQGYETEIEYCKKNNIKF